jgi:hypothetical protein
MRVTGIVAAVVVGLLSAGAARAGVYDTEEPSLLVPDPRVDLFHNYRNQLKELQSVPADSPNRAAVAVSWVGASSDAFAPLRVTVIAHEGLRYLSRESPGLAYLRRVTELEARERAGRLSLEDRINLGACYIRLRDYRKAIRLLEPEAARQKHFMLLANLATAYELEGILERAVSYRQQALAAWPRMWPGWTMWQVNFYRKAEKYHLTLAQLRLKEAQRGPGREGETFDALFPGVRFVGPSGEYEPGGIAAEQWGELPADALQIVLQLVMWLPLDNRLYWLLGELLNARGDVVSAADILSELVVGRRYFSSPELRRHHLILQGVRKEAAVLQADLNPPVPLQLMQLLWCVAPREAVGVPGPVPALAQETGWTVILVDAQKRTGLAPPTPPPTKDDKDDKPPGADGGWIPPNWGHIGVGFAAGAVVAVLLAQQVRQARRVRVRQTSS